MPKMSGYEATKEIRAQEKTTARPRVPIIGLITNTANESHDKCLAAGMNACLPKPVIPSQLLKTIDKIVLVLPDDGSMKGGGNGDRSFDEQRVRVIMRNGGMQGDLVSAFIKDSRRLLNLIRKEFVNRKVVGM